MKYEIIDVDALGRIGKLTIGNKKMGTPNLFPVIHPYKNILSTSDLKDFGVECIFTNAYIIYQNEKLKQDVLKEGLHRYLNFDGLIATDCGAFQQYMYNDGNNKLEIDAESIEKFQEKIGSDFPVILDVPVQLDDDYETAKNKVLTTITRAKDNIKRRENKNCNWFGPIHGAKYFDLLKLSSLEMNKLDFSVYAIGGLVKLFLNYRFDIAIKILLNVKEILSPNKPIHMFGLGLPQFFSLAVACGCDLIDSAAYILYAKENRYFTVSTGTKSLDELEEFPCNCPICSKYNPKELKSFDNDLKTELLAKHNLYVSFSELKTIRQAIREGTLWELVEQRIRNHPNLVKAANLIKDFRDLFEIHEKIYKNHGRLYASFESLNRPLLHRYDKRINQDYRVPKNAKFLIILPELDVKGNISPSINKWIKYIDNNQLILREHLHFAFMTEFFGIIPYELTETFPMGQYESISSSRKKDILYRESLKKSIKFIVNYSKYYKKCGVLIPKTYINQFNEEIDFSKNHPIHDLIKKIQLKTNLETSSFTTLDLLIQFFEKS